MHPDDPTPYPSARRNRPSDALAERVPGAFGMVLCCDERRRVRSNRAAFRWLWVGQTASMIGTAISGLAIPTYAIVVLSATPFAVALLQTVQFAAFPVLGLFAGVWVDRWPRRTV